MNDGIAPTITRMRFVIRASLLVRHSSFVIRHFDHAY